MILEVFFLKYDRFVDGQVSYSHGDLAIFFLQSGNEIQI